MTIRLPRAVIRLGAREIGRRVLNPALPWEVQRRRLDRLVGSWPLPRGTSVTKTALNGVHAEVVAVGQPGQEAAGQTADPRGGAAVATVVHFHGGGYCVGSPAEARSWAARLSTRAGCRVVLPDYRLAPEHPHPAAVEDARAVLGAVLGEAADGRVIVSGDSAGGGLALAALLARSGSGDGAAGLASGVSGVAGCILLSPWLDLAADRAAATELVRRDVLLSPDWLEACASAYVPTADLADPSVSPLKAELAGLPPLLIQSGADDLLAPDAERLAVRASAAGVDVTYTRWPGLWHDFALQPDLVAAADSALSQASWFVARLTR
jgi:monoterpene epsilon-lactone hydrolase